MRDLLCLPSGCQGRVDDTSCEFCLCRFGSHLGCSRPHQTIECSICKGAVLAAVSHPAMSKPLCKRCLDAVVDTMVRQGQLTLGCQE